MLFRSPAEGNNRFGERAARALSCLFAVVVVVVVMERIPGQRSEEEACLASQLIVAGSYQAVSVRRSRMTLGETKL